MDRSPSQELIRQIRQLAAAVPQVELVEKCFVRKMGYHHYVDMHVHVDPDMTVARSHQIAHEVKNVICGKIASVRDVLVHIEPAKPKSDSHEI